MAIRSAKSKTKKSVQFVMTERADFDARQGFSRCDPPGVGVRFESSLSATADIWKDQSQNVVVRCECSTYRFSFDAKLKSGNAISDDSMDEFAEYLREVLLQWLVDGIDDLPAV